LAYAPGRFACELTAPVAPVTAWQSTLYDTIARLAMVGGKIFTRWEMWGIAGVAESYLNHLVSSTLLMYL